MELSLHDGAQAVTSMGVCVIARNNESYLRSYLLPTLHRMEQLYPSVTFAYYFYENDSEDGTVAAIKEFKEKREERVVLKSEKLGLNDIGYGTCESRMQRMVFVRNRMLNHVRDHLTSKHTWCLFIDTDIYFDEMTLQAMFECAPARNNIVMMTCNTTELADNTGLDDDVPSDVSFVTQNHYYDTFAFIDENDKMYYPNCISGGCTRTACQNARANASRMLEDVAVRDVRSAWGGFVLISASVFAHTSVCWKSLIIKPNMSLCEHIHLCDVIRTVTGKRIISLTQVQCYWYQQRLKTLCVSMTSIPSRLKDLVPKLRMFLKWRSVEKLFLNVPDVYKRFPEWDGALPIELQELMLESNGRLCIVRGEDHGPATKYLGAVGEMQGKKPSWVFVCDDDQTYNLEEINRVFQSTVSKGSTTNVWQNGMEEEELHGICGPIAGFKGLFVHSTVLERLAEEHPKDDAMFSVDDQWFLLYCFLHEVCIKDTGLTRKDIFLEGESLGLTATYEDALWMEKPRGHVLRAYIRQHLEDLMKVANTTWRKWNIVKHTDLNKETDTIAIVVPQLEPYDEPLFSRVFAQTILSKEAYVPCSFEYYFMSPTKECPFTAVEAFARNRTCYYVTCLPEALTDYFEWDVKAARHSKFALRRHGTQRVKPDIERHLC